MQNINLIGYKINDKIYAVHTRMYNIDNLWNVCLREVHLLINKYKTFDNLKNAFENIIQVEYFPNAEDIKKNEIFLNVVRDNNDNIDWVNLTKYCQCSFINILESGNIFNVYDSANNLIILLDFDTNQLIQYSPNILYNEFESYSNWYIKINYIDQKVPKNTIVFQMSFLDIKKLQNMPVDSVDVLIAHMQTDYNQYKSKIQYLDDQITQVNNAIIKSSELYGHSFINDQLNNMSNNLILKKKEISQKYDISVYSNRLELLLIDN